MKQRPILMSAPMVRAILAGNKTQTRRIIKPGTPLGSWEETERYCHYGKIGDVLWVRETWHYTPGLLTQTGEDTYTHRADAEPLNEVEKWRPSIFMPREACRIYLEITGVRAEKLQDISEADAIAEGIERVDTIQSHRLWRDYLRKGASFASAVNSYSTLFESINGPGSWAENPFCWVIEFKRVEKP